MQYPSNSQTNIPVDTQVDPPAAEEKVVKKVVTGTAQRKNKTLTRRIMGHFGGMDVGSIVDYVIGDVLVPALKDMIADGATQTIQGVVYGITGRMGGQQARPFRPGAFPRPFQQPPVQHISYNQMGQQARPMTQQQGPHVNPYDVHTMNRQARAMHDFGDILLDSSADAHTLLNTLYGYFQEGYQFVTVADLYASAGMASDAVDERWGWASLQGSRVSRSNGGGFRLVLPPPIPITVS
jgi:hypothetical protein